jgi:hypothetical protein
MHIDYYQRVIGVVPDAAAQLHQLYFPSGVTDLDLAAQYYLAFAPELVGVTPVTPS